jgi:hypothetical protein
MWVDLMNRTIPEMLSGEDGEVVFVRRELGETATQARARALADGTNVLGMDVDEVEMLPVPEHFTGIEYEWATVKPGTEGAAPFWRFSV